MTLKAWRTDEYDIYAAETLEEAVDLAMKQTGLPREDVYDEDYAGEVDPSQVVTYVDDGGPVDPPYTTTIGELLKGMKAPGLLVALED